MTNVPSRTRPVTRPGPPHAMGICGCHGMGAWSRRSRVALWWAPLSEWDRETRRVPRDGPRAVPAWPGGGWPHGQGGRAVSERNSGGKKYRAIGDTSRMTGPDRASNTTCNNFVYKL
jgi:hypothetical protein